MLPLARFQSGEFQWQEMRESVFQAYHYSLRAFAEAGCNVIAEHIIETDIWRSRLNALLTPFDIYLVAVKCPPEELARRECERGDRPVGDALRDAAICYGFCRHDLEINSMLPPADSASLILEQWQLRDRAKLSRFTQ